MHVALCCGRVTQHTDVLSLFSFGLVSSSYALTPASALLLFFLFFFLPQFWMRDNSSEITSPTPASGLRWISLARIFHPALAARVREQIQKTSPVASLKNSSRWGKAFECFGRSIFRSPLLCCCWAGQALLAGSGKSPSCLQSTMPGGCRGACRNRHGLAKRAWLSRDAAELAPTRIRISAFCCAASE